MSYLTKIINCICFLLLFFMFACQKDSTPISYQDTAKSIVENFNEGKLPHEKGETITTSILLKTTPQNELFIFTNYIKDGNYVFFRLQMEETKEKIKLKSTKIEKAQIIYLKNALIINDLNKTKGGSLFLGTNGKTKTISIKNTKFDYIFEGVGLGMYQETIAQNTDWLLRENVYAPPSFEIGQVKCVCHHKGSGDLNNCDAGGHGATSCTISPVGGGGYQVSCSGNYRACCKADSKED